MHFFLPFSLRTYCARINLYTPNAYMLTIATRFTAEAKASRPQLAHMPFGWGPRNCIGMRFALLGTKIAIMEILKKFSFVRGPETEV